MAARGLQFHSAMTLTTLSPHPRLLVRWFVQYNPMFTASALCVLGGVLLVSRSLGAGADVGLTAILELYQWLVIGVAALLYRRLLERRPAAILGIIQLVFMADPTLQLSALATSAENVATVCWVVLFALKWRALAWAFRLELSLGAGVIPPVVAALVALLPNARLLGVSDNVLPTALAFAVFAFGVIVVHAAPRVRSRQALGAVGAVMFPRLVRAAVAIGIVGTAYQCLNAVLASGAAALLPALAALSFAAVVAVASAEHEARIWTFTALGCVLCASVGAWVVVGLPLASVALLLASRGQAPRVLTAGVMAAVAAVAVPAMHRGGAALLSMPIVVAVAAATLALLYVLVRRRAWSALPALALLHAKWILMLATMLAPRSNGQWGGALLLAGFILLPAGVALHRRLSRVLARDDDARERDLTSSSPPMSTAPASSAAVATGIA